MAPPPPPPTEAVLPGGGDSALADGRLGYGSELTHAAAGRSSTTRDQRGGDTRPHLHTTGAHPQRHCAAKTPIPASTARPNQNTRHEHRRRRPATAAAPAGATHTPIDPPTRRERHRPPPRLDAVRARTPAPHRPPASTTGGASSPLPTPPPASVTGGAPTAASPPARTAARPRPPTAAQSLTLRAPAKRGTGAGAPDAGLPVQRGRVRYGRGEKRRWATAAATLRGGAPFPLHLPPGKGTVRVLYAKPPARPPPCRPHVVHAGGREGGARV